MRLPSKMRTEPGLRATIGLLRLALSTWIKGLTCVALLTLVATDGNAADLALKTVTVDEFMQGHVLGSINVPVVVPADYEPAALPNANFGYSYWMNPKDVAGSNATSDLPIQNGYMYGKLTPNTGYDATRDLFIGLEEPETIEKFKKLMTGMKLERYRFGPYAIALMQYSMQGNRAYVMYVATNISTNVVYIALRPPGNSQEVGDQVWNRLKSLLQESRRDEKAAERSNQRGSTDYSVEMGMDATAESQIEFIKRFAALAHDRNDKELLAMLDPYSVSGASEEQVQQVLNQNIYPFFAQYKELKQYEKITRAQAADGRIGLWHYTFIVDSDGNLKPFQIAVIGNGTDMKVLGIDVGQCVKGRHPAIPPCN